MASQAIESQGIELQRGDGATPTEAFTKIAEVQDFNGPGGEAQEIDVSSLDSTATEFLLGLADEGTISMNGLLVPGDTAQTGLRTDRTNRTLRNFKLVLTDDSSTTLTFAAYVKSFSISGAVNDAAKFSCSLRISGAVTWS